MYIYAGIDEAGYGPMFGPLVLGCAVFAIEGHPDSGGPPDLWGLLSPAVAKKPSRRRAVVAVNDSKKLYTPAAGIRHLETAALTFAGLAGVRAETVQGWLDAVTPREDRPAEPLPWYVPADGALPVGSTGPEIAVAGNVLGVAAKRAGVAVPYLSVIPVYEDRFNQMTAATRSKAAVNFTFVAKHLSAIWERFSDGHPVVVVDRQSGRTRYRELLAAAFGDAQVDVLDETPDLSRYHLRREGPKLGRMTVSFQTGADEHHLPTALASICAKYTRELLMERFNAYFAARVDGLKPTAGYALDGKRFWKEIEDRLPKMGIDPGVLRRVR